MNDDEYGTVLLRPLRVEPVGPPRIDVARAMREGRRMRRGRWAMGGGFLAAIVAALVTGSLLIAPAAPHRPVLPPDPALPKSCTLAALPTGKYSSVEVGGADPTGRWFFGTTNPVANTGPIRYLIWHDGVLVADAAMPGEEPYLREINSSGVVVGESRNAKHESRPVVYRDGKFSLLKGGRGDAQAINDDGVIVGSLGDDQNAVPVRWRSPGAEPERLPIPSGTHTESESLVLAPDGTIAGRVEPPYQRTVLPSSPPYTVPSAAYLWLPDGTRRELQAPPVPEDPRPYLEPVVFRLGWLYVEQRVHGRVGNELPAITRVPLLRYDPVSGVWQTVGEGKGAPPAQLPASARGHYQFGSPTAAVYVGARILRLPMTQPIADPEVDSASVASVSDDVHTITGNLTRGAGDPTQPFRPVVWHCE